MYNRLATVGTAVGSGPAVTQPLRPQLAVLSCRSSALNSQLLLVVLAPRNVQVPHRRKCCC